MIKKTGLWFCCAMAFAAVPAVADSAVADSAAIKSYSEKSLADYVQENVMCLGGAAQIRDKDRLDVYTTITIRDSYGKDDKVITCDAKGFYLDGKELNNFGVAQYVSDIRQKELPKGIKKECIGDQYYLISHMYQGRVLVTSGITPALKNGQPEQCSQN